MIEDWLFCYLRITELFLLRVSKNASMAILGFCKKKKKSQNLCSGITFNRTAMPCRTYPRRSAACRCKWSRWGTHTWSFLSCLYRLHSHTLQGFPCTHQYLAHEEETRGQNENKTNLMFPKMILWVWKSYRWPVPWWCRCNNLVFHCRTGSQTHLKVH